MTRFYDSILELVGNTPLIRLHKITPDNVDVYAKVEYFNPAGSVKDRIALAMIEDAEASGVLKRGATIIEPTNVSRG